MSDDRRRSEQYASRRDEVLRPWIAHVVYPFSKPMRLALESAGLGRFGVHRAGDLRELPVTPVDDLGDGRAHVLRPTAASMAAFGPWTDRVRLRLADAFGRRPELARQRVDPEHKPVLWTAAPTPTGHLFSASTPIDLDRLAALGRRSLAISGVHADDRVLVLDASAPGIGLWQLVAGCRDAGVAVLHAGPRPSSDLVRLAAPTVIAGDAASLCHVLDRGAPASVRLLIRHDGAFTTAAEPSRIDATDLPVAEWWAPAGVRAAWVRCPGGTGHHTWPSHEVVEVGDDDALVWSAVGWRGSVWLRVGLGVRGRIHDDPCPACARTTPRVEVVAP